MATIRKEFTVAAPPERVWGAIRDFGAPQRLAGPGVLSAAFDGKVRTVSMASGNTSREMLVSIDDAERRLVYAMLDRFEHHNAAFQVFPEGDESRVVWVIDMLPDEAAAPMAGLIDASLDTMRRMLAGT